jgi:hypothetical protein
MPKNNLVTMTKTKKNKNRNHLKYIYFCAKLLPFTYMKFTKEDAYKDLVGKMTAKGETLYLSERSVNAQLETLIPLIASEEMELADFVEKVLPCFQTSNANIRTDISKGIKDYKDKNPQPKPNPNPNPNPTDPNAALLARLEALEQKNRENEATLKAQGIKKDLSTKMKELGIKSDKWIESMVSTATITDDFDVEAKAKNYLELYNSMMADVNPNITPFSPNPKPNTYVSDTIKAASELAKQNSLIGNV